MKAEDLTPDMRKMRAQQMTAHVMNAISKYLADDGAENYSRLASHALLDLFYENGVDIITDAMRADAGLPPRGPKGWTQEELLVMEARRMEALARPMPPFIINSNQANTSEVADAYKKVFFGH